MKGRTEISGGIILFLSPVVIIIFCDTFLNQIESPWLIYSLAGPEDPIFSTESQNSRGWKGPLWVI